MLVGSELGAMLLPSSLSIKAGTGDSDGDELTEIVGSSEDTGKESITELGAVLSSIVGESDGVVDAT